MIFSREISYYNYEEAMPHLGWQKGWIQRGGTPSLCIEQTPMMAVGHGFIPAALDPSDPKTWTVPVYFTR
jgi:hypothetical protein